MTVSDLTYLSGLVSAVSAGSLAVGLALGYYLGYLRYDR